MRFAVKRLSRSDLTFFEPMFRSQNAGNQKSINLNRDVFVDQFYPDFPEVIAAAGGQLGVRLQIDGPGVGRASIDIQRKIVKGDAYKNYRLNGEIVRNPDEDAARFDSLAEGDLAVLAFEGAAAPGGVHLFVLAASEPADEAVRGALAITGSRTMVAISREDLARAIALAPPDHPLHGLLLDPADAADLEMAAEGDSVATRRLLGKPGVRRVSAEQLAEARRRAEETGREGEQLIAGHFAQAGADIHAWSWSSSANAICPWDFNLITAGGEVRVEVKATRGVHGASFHISMAEIEAATDAVRYDIYRVSGLGDEGGSLRVAENVRAFAQGLIDALAALQKGVRPDGFTVDPALLTWSEPVAVSWLDADEP